MTSNAALCDLYGLARSAYEPTLYFSRDRNKNLDFLVVVQVDNYVYTGTVQRMENFGLYLKIAFDVGECRQNNFDIYGASVSRLKNGTVVLNQEEKIKEITNMKLISNSKTEHSGNGIVTMEELTRIRRVIGKILFVGRMSHPILLRIASTMAAKIGEL